MSGGLRLTRRGLMVAAVAAAGLVMGWGFGGRSLNAVVVPAAALLAISWVGVSRVEAPSVDRAAPTSGFPGETATVELAVDAARAVSVTVADGVPEGLSGGGRFQTVADGRRVTYDVTLDRRGVYDLGPTRVTVSDVFGLWETTFEVEAHDEVVVFPRIRPLYGSPGIVSGYVSLTDERGQFDTIREYQQGDALRDVNWKASAKRNGELVVTEFAGEGAEHSVMLGVGSGPNPDAAAEAAATLATRMLDAGLAVGVVTPHRRIGPGSGTGHRNDLLTVLAHYDGTGPNPDFGDVDVGVVPTEGGARIDTGAETRSFESMAASGGETPA